MAAPPLLLLALLGSSFAGTATLSGERWATLQEAPPAERPDAPAPSAITREVVLRAVDDGLEVEATWTLWSAEPAFFTGTVIGPGAHVTTLLWNDRPAAAMTGSAGTTLAGWVDGEARLTLRAFVPSDALRLLPAARGTVRLTDPTRPALDTRGEPATRDGDVWTTGAAHLAPRPAPPTVDAGTLVLAHAGIGLTLGDAEITGRARVGWQIRRGRLEQVAIRTAGLGADLEVEGRNVASWRRAGDRVVVSLREPATDRVDVTLSWSTPTPAGAEVKLPTPRVEPLDAFRTEATLQLAREDGLELTPSLPGWEPLPSRDLPAWGRDLVIGAPAATFRAAGARAGQVDLLRFEPVALPPVVIDVADHRVAATSEGRVLARALYEVRNERAPWLRIAPPPGWRIVGVRVGDQTARPLLDEGAGWRIPIPRSVETVDGMLPFTVEVAFIGEDEAFTARTRRALPMPTVDATIARWRATLFLPPGHRNLLRPGAGGVVEAFATGEGIAYGFAPGTVSAAVADATFEDAVSAWLANDFDGTRQALDALRDLGASGEKIELLQSNLDLIDGKRDGDDYASQRIRSQAKARAADEEVVQKDLERKAEERRRAGDLAASSTYYQQALEIGDKLARIEGEKSVESQSRNVAYGDALKEIAEVQTNRQEVLGEEETALPWDVEGEPEWDVEGELAWDVDELPDWARDDDSFGTITVSGRGSGGGGVGYGSVGAAGQGVRGSMIVQAESVQNTPVSRSYQSRVERRSRRGKRKRGKGRATSDDWDDAFPTVMSADLPTPEVHASALSIFVPAIGEPVRVEHQLVPAAAPRTIPIHASERRKTR